MRWLFACFVVAGMCWGQTYHTDAERVLIPAAVFDSKGKFVEGLGREAFALRQDSVGRVLESVRLEEGPIAMALVCDVSGSMKTHEEAMRAAVAELQSQAQQGDEFYSVLVRDQPEEMRWTRSFSVPAAEGGTALYDSIYLAMDGLRKKRQARKVMVVITDGEDNHSRYSEKDLRRLSLEANVEVFPVVLWLAHSFASELGQLFLEELAKETGGRYTFVRKANGLQDAVSKLELRERYLLSYSPNVESDGRYHKVDVKVKGCDGCSVAWRRGFVASER